MDVLHGKDSRGISPETVEKAGGELRENPFLSQRHIAVALLSLLGKSFFCIKMNGIVQRRHGKIKTCPSLWVVFFQALFQHFQSVKALVSRLLLVVAGGNALQSILIFHPQNHFAPGKQPLLQKGTKHLLQGALEEHQMPLGQKRNDDIVKAVFLQTETNAFYSFS